MPNHPSFQRIYRVYDSRTGQYLAKAKYPAQWVSTPERASLYSLGTIAAIKRDWPYIEDCVIQVVA